MTRRKKNTPKPGNIVYCSQPQFELLIIGVVQAVNQEKNTVKVLVKHGGEGETILTFALEGFDTMDNAGLGYTHEPWGYKPG